MDDEPSQVPASVVVETVSGESVKALLDQGAQIGADAAALVKETAKANALVAKRQRRRDIMIGAVLALIVAGIVTLGIVGVANYQTNTSNTKVLQRLDTNQAGIDELVAFVHDLQAQAAQSNSSSTQQAVATIEALLCTSTDPARQIACARLDINPVEVP